MASNIIPKNQDDLLSLVQSMMGGLREHETALGVKQNTEARMTAAAETLRAAEMAFGQSRKEWAEARQALKSADATARTFLMTARKVLTTRLGERWGAGWEATGFPGQSTAVPETQPERFQLCEALHGYFAGNPAAEVAALGVTAAAAQAQYESIRAARAALNRSAAARADALKARDAAYEQLRRRAQGLVAEIGHLMNENDPRWLAFGLNIPGAGTVPEPVEEFTLRPDGPGAVRVTWPRARRAEYYRLFAQVMGVDAEMSFRLRVKDREARLEGLPGGQTVRVQIVAANETGEAVASAVQECVVE